MTLFYLVCFDIVDDKIRRRAVKALGGYGVRVQKSVFECPNLSPDRFAKLRNELDELIDHAEDTFRFYPLCRDCVAGVRWTGLGDPPRSRNFHVA